MGRLSDDESWISEPPCPHLPRVCQRLTADWTRAHRGMRAAGLYQAALEYAQSLWMEGKPAQAILQLNKAWSAELVGDEEVLMRWPLPYRALKWMLVNAPDDGFLGNPVRHFQHLATRVSGGNVELRSWRAWACFHLAKAILSSESHPGDELQIEREGLEIPELGEVIRGLCRCSGEAESTLFEEVLCEGLNC